MKKSIFIALVLLTAGVAALFAESAVLLPAGVFRFRIAPVFNFAQGAFDEDGAYQEYDEGEGASKAYSTGLALEYGILNWLSLAAQWTPGWVAWSDVDQNLGNDSTVNANGVSDLFAGVAVQLIGQQAPVKSELFRFTLAPGLKIPFPGADALDEYENWQKEEAVTAANPDNHALGIGGRAYFDYIPGILDGRLVFNLYGGFVGYPIKSKVKNYSVAPILERIPGIAAYYSTHLTTEAGQQEVATAFQNTGGDPSDTVALQNWIPTYISGQVDQAAKETAELDVTFGYELGLEFEVSVSDIPLDRNQKLLFAAGLPFTYSYSPGTEVDSLIDAEEKSTFTISPYASLFLTSLPLPIQLQLGYTIPVAGVNSDARHILVFQAKFFLRF